MKFLFVTPTDVVGGCELYRQLLPAESLHRSGHAVVVMTRDEIVERGTRDRNFLLSFDLIQEHRVAVFEDVNRNRFREIALAARALGTSWVNDYDDDYTNQYRKVHDGTIDVIDTFSALIVSTPHLQEIMRPYNQRIHVARNCIAPEMFTPHINDRVLPENELIIGLTGSATHGKDWDVVEQPVRAILAKYPNCKLFITGFIPSWTWDIPKYTVRNIYPDVPADQDWVQLSRYPKILRNIDILLAPVDPGDRFNWSKSNLKAIEGMAAVRRLAQRKAGCAVIATGGELPIYKDAVIPGQTGILVDHNNPQKWFDSIELLVTSSETRTKLQAQGYKFCMQNFDVFEPRNVAARLGTYRKVMQADKRVAKDLVARLADLV